MYPMPAIIPTMAKNILTMNDVADIVRPNPVQLEGFLVTALMTEVNMYTS